jgi:short-subunit dehydrogenase
VAESHQEEYTMARETVLITGASSGIGLELAKLFAADNSNLVLVARREESLNQLATELREKHDVEVQVVAKDLADVAAVAGIYDTLDSNGTQIDVVVNNAGFGAVGQIAELDTKQQVNMVQVNVTALTYLTRLFLPDILEQGRGGIFNVASTAAFQAGPGMGVYYATKAYVLSLTEALYEELSGTDINVTCLAPGPTETGFGADSGIDSSLLFKFGVKDAKKVAKEGYAGFRRGKAIVIPGLKNKLGAFGVRLGPHWLVRKIVKRLNA